jgi:hypothetical protein
MHLNVHHAIYREPPNNSEYTNKVWGFFFLKNKYHVIYSNLERGPRKQWEHMVTVKIAKSV